MMNPSNEEFKRQSEDNQTRLTLQSNKSNSFYEVNNTQISNPELKFVKNDFKINHFIQNPKQQNISFFQSILEVQKDYTANSLDQFIYTNNYHQHEHIQKKINKLKQECPLYREMGGDGNSFYRAVIFNYFEFLLGNVQQRQTKQQLHELLDKLRKNEFDLKFCNNKTIPQAYRDLINNIHLYLYEGLYQVYQYAKEKINEINEKVSILTVPKKNISEQLAYQFNHFPIFDFSAILFMRKIALDGFFQYKETLKNQMEGNEEQIIRTYGKEPNNTIINLITQQLNINLVVRFCDKKVGREDYKPINQSFLQQTEENKKGDENKIGNLEEIMLLQKASKFYLLYENKMAENFYNIPLEKDNLKQSTLQFSYASKLKQKISTIENSFFQSCQNDNSGLQTQYQNQQQETQKQQQVNKIQTQQTNDQKKQQQQQQLINVQKQEENVKPKYCKNSLKEQLDGIMGQKKQEVITIEQQEVSKKTKKKNNNNANEEVSIYNNIRQLVKNGLCDSSQNFNIKNQSGSNSKNNSGEFKFQSSSIDRRLNSSCSQERLTTSSNEFMKSFTFAVQKCKICKKNISDSINGIFICLGCLFDKIRQKFVAQIQRQICPFCFKELDLQEDLLCNQCYKSSIIIQKLTRSRMKEIYYFNNNGNNNNGNNNNKKLSQSQDKNQTIIKERLSEIEKINMKNFKDVKPQSYGTLSIISNGSRCNLCLQILDKTAYHGDCNLHLYCYKCFQMVMENYEGICLCKCAEIK